MYQLEVKRYLVEHRCPPADGWEVTVDVDAMELARGGKHPPDKSERARRAEAWLVREGVGIGAHPVFGRADVVATRPGAGTVVVEVEGDSKKQPEQALYSALGQAVLSMKTAGDTHYGLAVPDSPVWERQLAKIPAHVRERLSLTLWLVGETGVRVLKGS